MSSKKNHRLREQQLRRKKPAREPYSRILLVFEGQSTEPEYFRDFRKSLRLSPMNLVFAPHIGESDPLSIVRYGIRYYTENGSDFEKVFCIVDRDRHPTYQDAVNLVASHQLTKKKKLALITSNPCFEVWLLQHFRYSTAPIKDPGVSGSDAARVISELAGFIPGYEKNCRGVFEQTKHQLPEAMQNSRKLLNHHMQTGGDGNPSTEIHLVVDALNTLRAERDRAFTPE